MASSTIINIPTDEKVFERNCIPIFVDHLNDPNVKFYGTRGKKQSGLDLIGRRERDPSQPVGIQCKLITRGGKLTKHVIRREVEQAMSIEPALTEYYIVTTATDDPTYDSLATIIAQEEAERGRQVDIQVWGWDTLQEKIRNNPKALAAFDPDYSASTNRMLELQNETVSGQAGIHSQLEMIFAQGAKNYEGIQLLVANMVTGPIDTARSTYNQHIDTQIDQYRDMLNAGKPRTALDLLRVLDDSLDETSATSARARVKVNIAIALLQLGDETDAARLLDQAYELNPTDSRTRANRILSLTLQGDLAGAWTLAQDILTEEPDNVGAAGLVFHVAALDNFEQNPLAIVPPGLLDDHNVRIHHINYLRQKGAADSWWSLAAETLERFPEEGNSLRMAGDALIGEAISDDAMERFGSVRGDRRTKLTRGAELLQLHWDEIRHFEHAAHPDLCMVGYNLITAYRALGYLDQAKRIADQVLATGTKDSDAMLMAAWVAIDREQFDEAVILLRTASPSGNAVVPLLFALSNSHKWTEVLEEATDDRRAKLSVPAREILDIFVFRAKQYGKAETQLNDDVEQLLQLWPLSVGAHIAVADTYRLAKPELFGAMVEKTRSLITSVTSYSDRVMFARLSLYRDAWDDIIGVLNEFVSLDQPSDPLLWLAYAYANAPTQASTSSFYQSLSSKVISLPDYARLAGVAEYNRGDLVAAERYFRLAISECQTDLRSILQLSRTLMRANREEEARNLVTGVDDEALDGSPEDFMRLAHQHCRAGEATRALRLGYRMAATNRNNEAIVSLYPSLIFMNQSLPSSINQVGPAQKGFWFDLEGLEGTRDATGIIDDEKVEGVNLFPLDHPLAVALTGRSVSEVIELPAKLGSPKRYRIRQLKHKYVWLLNDIMATHSVRFPETQSLFEMSIKDGDIQPILNMFHDRQGRNDLLAEIYASHPVPLSLIAVCSKKAVLQMADELRRQGVNIRTCIGVPDEYIEAITSVRQARGKGVAIDTLTVWILCELGHLKTAKDYFGRLCVARSTMDEVIELRGKVANDRGRKFATIRVDGEQICPKVHSPEDTERRLEAVNAFVEQLETHCEILPVDGSQDVRLDSLFDNFGSKIIFDPINLARAEDLIILSDDLNLRQFAESQGVKGGAWLQAVLNVFAREALISRDQYLAGVGMLGALRHGHLSLNVQTLLQMLSLDDPRSFDLFNAAIQFIGGRNAHMPSHIDVSVETMRGVWRLNLPSWQQSRAIGRLLTQLVRSRPDDWKAVLHIIDAELAEHIRVGDYYAQWARDYMATWIKGHFYDLAEIRSEERATASVKSLPLTKKEKKSRSKKVS
ncbi:PIN domain-containing protein [Gluconobacter cerinus]|uniref:Tetratricopeptide repeat protein n=1 Tax=Gluconobacter cerinus TaxID=38307 RepID=A0A1B6VPK9_9PROT|nr:tetratricopeptide repeat protein [Gluconobacter cerinus]OAJ69143.1 Tetratricopeptide repeat protein [Gluconobacter cerinus]